MSSMRPRALLTTLALVLAALIGSTVSATPAVADDLVTGLRLSASSAGQIVPGTQFDLIADDGSSRAWTVKSNVGDGTVDLALPPGDYQLTVKSLGFKQVRYNNGEATAAGPSITVEDNGQLTRVDIPIVATTGSVIGGWVSSEQYAELPSVAYTLFRQESSGLVPVQRLTSTLGWYRFNPVPAGTYLVRVGEYRNVGTSWWPNAATSADATPVTVTTNEVRIDRDTTLERGTSLKGSVSNNLGEKPTTIDVTVYGQTSESGWVPLTKVRTHLSSWTVDGLLTGGSYRLEFTDPGGWHAPTFSGGATTLAEASTLVTGPDPVTHDVTMAYIPQASWTDAPTITGQAVLGQQLAVDSLPVSISDPGTTYDFQWWADEDPIPGATSSSFVISEDQLGKRLRVHVKATVPGYRTSEEVRSVQTTWVVTTSPATVTVGRRTPTTISLTWSPSPRATSYRVHVVSGAVRRTITTTQPATTITGLPTGTTTSVSVTADAGHGPSTPRSVTTSTTTMVRPAARVAKVTKNAVTLSWSRPEGATRYRVVYWTGKKAKVTRNLGNVPSVAIGGLKKKTSYSFYVQAIAANGQVTTSPTLTVKTKKK